MPHVHIHRKRFCGIGRKSRFEFVRLLLKGYLLVRTAAEEPAHIMLRESAQAEVTVLDRMNQFVKKQREREWLDVDNHILERDPSRIREPECVLNSQTTQLAVERWFAHATLHDSYRVQQSFGKNTC